MPVLGSWLANDFRVSQQIKSSHTAMHCISVC